MDKTTIAVVGNRSDLEEFLDKFVSTGRHRLDNVLNRLSQSSKSPSALLAWAQREKTYPLMCAFSQEMFHYNLENNHLDSSPFISDSVRKSVFSHCSTVMPIRITDENKTVFAVLDPTYSQFQLPTDLYPAFGLKEIMARKSPVQALLKTTEGQGFWNEIKENGYFIVTPEKAKLYIESLCPSVTLTPEKAYQTLTNPPFDPLNLKHGKGRLREMGCLDIPVTTLLGKERPDNQPPTSGENIPSISGP